jgi:hypothetical protein
MGGACALAQAMMRRTSWGRSGSRVDHVLARTPARLSFGAGQRDRRGDYDGSRSGVAHMNGVGGDNFLLIREAKTGRVYALNGSGRAGSKASPAFFASRQLAAVPSTGIMSVSVPGAVRAWEDALKRFGTISLSDALQPAIDYAERGFPVSTRLSLDITEESRKVGLIPR